MDLDQDGLSTVLVVISKPWGIADFVDDRPGLDMQEGGPGTAYLEDNMEETWGIEEETTDASWSSLFSRSSTARGPHGLQPHAIYT